MVERVVCDLTGNIQGLTGAVFRYDVLERLARSAARREVSVLAFGFGPGELRLVLEGGDTAIANVLRGVKVGTTRAATRWGLRLIGGGSVRIPIAPGTLEDAVIWAHSGPIEGGSPGPLANPWSSHRDLMGFRAARFYDVSCLRGRVDARRVHAACGGEALPEGWPPRDATHQDLSFLLRVAGAVLGVLPADRRCFRLFVHLARARGWTNGQMAGALALTKRRIRQLASTDEPNLELALVTIGDVRLSMVP